MKFFFWMKSKKKCSRIKKNLECCQHQQQNYLKIDSYVIKGEIMCLRLIIGQQRKRWRDKKNDHCSVLCGEERCKKKTNENIDDTKHSGRFNVLHLTKKKPLLSLFIYLLSWQWFYCLLWLQLQFLRSTRYRCCLRFFAAAASVSFTNARVREPIKTQEEGWNGIIYFSCSLAMDSRLIIHVIGRVYIGDL